MELRTSVSTPQNTRFPRVLETPPVRTGPGAGACPETRISRGNGVPDGLGEIWFLPVAGVRPRSSSEPLIAPWSVKMFIGMSIKVHGPLDPGRKLHCNGATPTAGQGISNRKMPGSSMPRSGATFSTVARSPLLIRVFCCVPGGCRPNGLSPPSARRHPRSKPGGAPEGPHPPKHAAQTTCIDSDDFARV